MSGDVETLLAQICITGDSGSFPVRNRKAPLKVLAHSYLVFLASKAFGHQNQSIE